MKKVFMFVLILLVILTSVNLAYAASDFSLVDGALSAQDADLLKDENLLKDFFKGLQISAAYSSQQDNYALTGSNSVEKSGQDGNISYVLNCTGDIAGTFNSQTGGFEGTFHYEMSETDKSGGITMTDKLFDMDGEFTAIGSPDSTSIKMTFHGINKRLQGYTKEYFFDVTFAVQGALPFTQEPAEESEETDNPAETEVVQPAPAKLEDSGARFSDFSGQVEVLIPKGYDDDGKPIYDEEDWTIAKLDMPLPEGTRIKTSDRSSVILSFADMTTFVMKPESEIWLSKPEAGKGPFKLLIGSLWVNMKKGIIDGTMDIEMSQAASGIKGTTFVLEEDGETSTLKVIEGTVEFASKATGESVDVEAGEAVSATADGLGKIEKFNVKAETAEWAEYGAKMPTGNFPLWAIVAIAGGVALITVIVVIAAMSRRNKRKPAAMHPVHAQGAYPPPAQAHPSAAHVGFCMQCGAPLAPGAAFCAKCGKKAN